MGWALLLVRNVHSECGCSSNWVLKIGSVELWGEGVSFSSFVKRKKNEKKKEWKKKISRCRVEEKKTKRKKKGMEKEKCRDQQEKNW